MKTQTTDEKKPGRNPGRFIHNPNKTTAPLCRKIGRRERIKSKIVGWAIDGRISAKAAQDALEFMRLTSA